MTTKVRRMAGISMELFIQVFLIIIAIIFIFPFVWMISTALKPATEVLSWPPIIFPKRPTITNLLYVFKTAPFGRYYLNSIFVSGVCTLSILITSSLAGYIFAKIKFFGRDLVFYIILGTAILPMQSYLVLLYMMVGKMGGVDTYWGLILPGMVMSFGIFLLRQTIYSIPDELIDAARIDGASELAIYSRVILPLCKSALSAIAIYAFTVKWGQLIWPLVIVSTKDKFTTELGLTAFSQRFVVQYGPISSAAVICTIPALMVFIVFNKQIIRGLTLTGLKG